ncbi:glycosyltransferase involved in cell wall biosynthesis [Lipingzhangella halophila]|uniref:Glycosyltransferase involved in cell wall biosynthesis n=1 Tax=Lipingzhangella halophila TaxID=1783352 RepID=A0A7W7RMC3_9ACTN|nr:glycosyltransferase family 4 protein [Lipingzhangella halophila]MBB4934653.1 glycosyltransferase involved in cell wall biosynthesis [Lipingzhangella halophila]
MTTAGTVPPREVHAILPGDVADPAVPSGGNTYDRRVCRDLAAEGWLVREVAVAGAWPRPDDRARAALSRALAALPSGAVVLLDGLVACGVPDVVVPQARRLRLVVLVHLPLAAETALPPAVAADLDARERETLRAARAVVPTSAWAASHMTGGHGIDPGRVHPVPPGVDPAPLAAGTDGASRLLCVAAVTRTKGHDLLVDALAALTDLPWSCECAGSLRRAPGFVAELRRRIDRLGLAGRVRLTGPQTAERLSALYAASDLVVLASRVETYGMVVTEALARGIPVLATAVGGVPQALGTAPDGSVPGSLVPPESPALAGALRRWLEDDDLRRRLRSAARGRRGGLGGWERTSRSLDTVLEKVRREEPRSTA